MSSSISDEARKAQDKQQEKSPSNKTHRAIGNMSDDILNPSHPLFQVYGKPWLDNIERNHAKSKTYLKDEQDDPMYHCYARNNNQTHGSKDHKSSTDERTAISNDLGINVNTFRHALLSIKSPIKTKKATKKQ